MLEPRSPLAARNDGDRQGDVDSLLVGGIVYMFSLTLTTYNSCAGDCVLLARR